MNKKLIAVSALATMLALPLVSLAFNAGAVPGTQNNININTLIDTIFAFMWPIIVAVVIIIFIVAAFLFMTAQGDPAKIAAARQAVIWGIVGVVVLLLAFSITFIVRNQLGL